MKGAIKNLTQKIHGYNYNNYDQKLFAHDEQLFQTTSDQSIKSEADINYSQTGKQAV